MEDISVRIDLILNLIKLETQEDWRNAKISINHLLELLVDENLKKLHQIEFDRIAINMQPDDDALRELNMSVSGQRQLNETIKMLQALRKNISDIKKINSLPKSLPYDEQRPDYF